MTQKLSHLDEQGRAEMVDVGDKPLSQRRAVAQGRVQMQPRTLQLIRDGAIKKGDVLMIARIAGIMAAKRTAELIPLCHPVALTKINVEIEIDEPQQSVVIRSTAQTIGQTGVEMEALTAVNVAALTIYDMAKAVDRSMCITDIRLLEKRGGVRGDYVAEEQS